MTDAVFADRFVLLCFVLTAYAHHRHLEFFEASRARAISKVLGSVFGRAVPSKRGWGASPGIEVVRHPTSPDVIERERGAVDLSELNRRHPTSGKAA